MHDRAAQRMLAQDPSIARDSIYTAIVCGDREEVARILAARPEAARDRGGARGWTPILYLAYTRFTHTPTIENALAIARLLLDHGADPNDFYMAGDARYTVLVGVAGEGEQDSPRQPYAAALFDLLLERGAEPFDIQVLYNTHFSGDILWWLELVYKHTIHTAARSGMEGSRLVDVRHGRIRIRRALSARDCGEETQHRSSPNGCWRTAQIRTRPPPATSGFPSAACTNSL